MSQSHQPFSCDRNLFVIEISHLKRIQKWMWVYQAPLQKKPRDAILARDRGVCVG